MSSPNHRFVLTGGPGAGKTTLIDALRDRGYWCAPDVARAIIRSRVEAGLSPRPEPPRFARMIFDADVENYTAAPPGEITFYDRGIVDALGMLMQSAAMAPTEMEANLHRYRYNRTAFLLPPWEAIYRTDDERDHTFDHAVRVFEATGAWYSRCGYSTLDVPRGPVPERVDFILAAARGATG